MDADIIVALIGLLGIAVAALFSGIGYFHKIRSERMRTRNNVLYHLLEIRHLIKSYYTKPDSLFNEYLDYCEDYYSRRGLNDDSEIPPELKTLLASHFQKLAETMMPSIDNDFIESFNGSISALAEDNPALAFRLKGKEQVSSLLKIQKQYLNEFSDISFPEEIPKEIKDAASDHAVNLNYDVLDDFMREIDKDIRLVSSFFNFSVKKLLKETKKTEVTFNPKEFDPLMDKVLMGLAEVIKTQVSSKEECNG